MKADYKASFIAFSERFVRCYWETVKVRRFPMTPDEPIEDNLEEILESVTWNVEHIGADHVILMRSGEWAWWKYVFRSTGDGFTIKGATARSLYPSDPHDLLAPPYDEPFRPFLVFVTECANSRINQKIQNKRYRQL